jgi:nucleoside-diphosphate kinase
VKELDLVFGAKTVPRTAQFKNSTLAIVKPHISNTKTTGKVIAEIINAGFNITDLENFHLDSVNAEEFLEVYKDVVPEYQVFTTLLLMATVNVGPVDGWPDHSHGDFRRREYRARVSSVLRTQ